MREDSFVSSTGLDQFSETAIFSGSDSETQGPPTPSQDQPALPDSEPLPTTLELPSSDENHVNHSPPEVNGSASSELNLDADVLLTVSEPLVPVEEVHTTDVQESTEPIHEKKEAEITKKIASEPSVHHGPHRSTSVLSRQLSTDSLSVSMFTAENSKTSGCCL